MQAERRRLHLRCVRRGHQDAKLERSIGKHHQGLRQAHCIASRACRGHRSRRDRASCEVTLSSRRRVSLEIGHRDAPSGSSSSSLSSFIRFLNMVTDRSLHSEGLPDDLPAYLDPQLFRDSRTLSSLFNVPHNDGSQQYSRTGSITNQSSLDNDSSRLVSSPEEANSAFTHWSAFNAPEGYDEGSSHTTGSPSSTTLDVSPSSNHEVPSSNFGGQRGQFDGNEQQRMSSTMPGWPYNYVTGASGPEFYPPMASNGVECRNWVPEGQNDGSTYHLPHQGQPWGGH